MERGNPARSVLFVSHDGVLGGPGRSQTLPYLKGYAEGGWRTRLLSYEKPERLAEAGLREATEADLARAGIRWTVLPYRRSMVRDLVAGLRAVRQLVNEEPPDLLHARSYVPALLCDLAGRGRGASLLFDMRGLWADEKVDGGLWSPRSPLFSLWKRLERRLLRRADGVVVLSEAGARLLRDEGILPATTPLEVIPCAADLEKFRPLPAEESPEALRAFSGKRVYVFLGATGTWYLLDAMLDFAADAVRNEPDARILFLTEDEAGVVARGLEARGVPADRVLLRRVPHEEVPRWISGARAGVFFIRPCRSKKASCPTKLGEFLACGVPVVINDGIGDTGEIVRGSRTGVVVEGLDAGSFARARAALDGYHSDSAMRGRCRTEAECRFDIRRASQVFRTLAARIATK